MDNWSLDVREDIQVDWPSWAKAESWGWCLRYRIKEIWKIDEGHSKLFPQKFILPLDTHLETIISHTPLQLNVAMWYQFLVMTHNYRCYVQLPFWCFFKILALIGFLCFSSFISFMCWKLCHIWRKCSKIWNHEKDGTQGLGWFPGAEPVQASNLQNLGYHLKCSTGFRDFVCLFLQSLVVRERRDKVSNYYYIFWGRNTYFANTVLF